MATHSMPPADLLDHLASADVDALQTILQQALQRLIEAEASAYIGAAPGERTPERRTYRNGHRARPFDTRLGRLDLQIPKLRTGSFFPSLLEPRRRIERALLAVIREAYVHGVSTRKVDDLVAALGGCHVSKSEVSRICSELDQELAAFRQRPLGDAAYPYVFFDATYEKVRAHGRVVSQAAVVAIGVRESGDKSVLGVAIGASESAPFWREFCRQLVARGLRGVRLVISDAHQGLRQALAACFAGASWRRCKVHFLRVAGAAVPKQHAPAVLAVLKTIFLQPTPETTRAAVGHALQVLEPRFPQVAARLREAEADLLAYLGFPLEHWRSISSTNLLERLNAEIDRRAKVVGIFPNTAALLRLTTAVLVEQHDAWQDGRRHFSQQSMAQLLADAPALPTSSFLEDLAA
jgi:putative transposase